MKITNNSSANILAKLGLGVPSGSAKPQLGLWMGFSFLEITLSQRSQLLTVSKSSRVKAPAACFNDKLFKMYS